MKTIRLLVTPLLFASLLITFPSLAQNHGQKSTRKKPTVASKQQHKKPKHHKKAYSNRPQVKRFINQMVSEYHFKRAELVKEFNKLTVHHYIIKKIKTPYESKPWYVYRRHFLNQRRIFDGVHFWQKNENALQRAYKQYGVPPSIIVAILGVETLYGERTGKHRVFDALSTLAFDYPPRAKFFRKELKQFLLLCRELDVKPRSVRGSYAGAIGQPQFMPSSYRHYAVDFSGNGKADLLKSPTDAIGSIANYLKRNGWHRNQPIAIPASFEGHAYQLLSLKTLKPRYSSNTLKKHGIHVEPPYKLPKRHLKSVIALRVAPHQPNLWIGFHNFYVITRYNTSKLYAMAVTQLATQIEQQRGLLAAKRRQQQSKHVHKHTLHKSHKA